MKKTAWAVFFVLYLYFSCFCKTREPPTFSSSRRGTPAIPKEADERARNPQYSLRSYRGTLAAARPLCELCTNFVFGRRLLPARNLSRRNPTHSLGTPNALKFASGNPSPVRTREPLRRSKYTAEPRKGKQHQTVARAVASADIFLFVLRRRLCIAIRSPAARV